MPKLAEPTALAALITTFAKELAFAPDALASTLIEGYASALFAQAGRVRPSNVQEKDGVYFLAP